AGATASRAWWGRAAPSGSSCRSTRPRRPRRRRTEPHGAAHGKRRGVLLLRGKMPPCRSARRSCGRQAAVRKAGLPRRAAFLRPRRGAGAFLTESTEKRFLKILYFHREKSRKRLIKEYRYDKIY